MKFEEKLVTFVYHLGVHCTDENLIVQSLLKNGDDLKARKIIVPRPKRYRRRIANLTAKYRGDPLPDDVQRSLFTDILLNTPAERVILSQESFLSGPRRALEAGTLYANADIHSIWLRYLFPENPCEFFIGICNPATFVPAILRKVGVPSYQEMMGKTDPRSLRWSRVISDIVDANPGSRVTVWCNEDTPLIWPTILRKITGVADNFLFDSEFSLLESIMSKEGFIRLRAYLNGHPPKSEEQRRRIFSAFLDKFALEEKIIEEIDLPGWTSNLVEECTTIYEHDINEISTMPNVIFVKP